MCEFIIQAFIIRIIVGKIKVNNVKSFSGGCVAHLGVSVQQK